MPVSVILNSRWENAESGRDRQPAIVYHTGGSDTVTYRTNLRGARLPVQLAAGLHYQPVGYRFVEDLRRDLTGETQRLVNYDDGVSKTPMQAAAVP